MNDKISLQEARRLERLFPERYRLEAKMSPARDHQHSDGYSRALFIYRVFERKELSPNWEVIFDSAPLGQGRNVYNGLGEWLTW